MKMLLVTVYAACSVFVPMILLNRNLFNSFEYSLSQFQSRDAIIKPPFSAYSVHNPHTLIITRFDWRYLRLTARISSILSLYKHCRISRSAAGLSYYLLLALFPMIVCASILITQFQINESDILRMITEWIRSPGTDADDVFSPTAVQWENPNPVSSAILFVIALTLFLSASAGAFRSLAQTADDIADTASPNLLRPAYIRRFGGIFGFLISYLFATLLFFTVYLSIFVMVLWDELILWLSAQSLPPQIPSLLGELRFLLLFLLFFCICFLLLLCIQPKSAPKIPLLPGSLFSAIGMEVATFYFSRFIRGSTEYSLVYGSLASPVLLMIWLYFCANIVLIGVAINNTCVSPIY